MKVTLIDFSWPKETSINVLGRVPFNVSYTFWNCFTKYFSAPIEFLYKPSLRVNNPILVNAVHIVEIRFSGTLINSDKVILTGNKSTNKIYYKHTGYPGGIKETNFIKMKKKNKSGDLIKLAIKRMIPSGPLGRKQISNCKIYSGSEHKHVAQNPKKLELGTLNNKNLLK